MRASKTLLWIWAFSSCCQVESIAIAQQYGWTKIAQPTTLFISTVSFVDSSNGWIGTIGSSFGKSILATNDGGHTWQQQTTSENLNVQSFSFIDQKQGWSVGNVGNAFGYITHTSNGGQTWQEQRQLLYRRYNGLGVHNLLEATVTGGLDSFFTTAGLIVRTTNGGQRWQEQRFLKGIGKADFVDSQRAWAIARTDSDSIRFIRTIDGGRVWEILPYDFSVEIFGTPHFDFIDFLRGWAVGRGNGFTEDPVVIGTYDGGITWKRIYKFPSDGTSGGPGQIAFADTLNGWIFADGFVNGGLAGVIYRTVDGGRNWTREAFSYRLAWPSGQALDLNHVWAGTTTGEVWRYGPITSVAEKANQIIPSEYVLLPNYPNPFNPVTTIEYRLPQSTKVVLTVHDILGKEVRTLVNKIQAPGSYRVSFEATGLVGGTYLYTLKTDDFEQTRSMTLLK